MLAGGPTDQLQEMPLKILAPSESLGHGIRIEGSPETERFLCGAPHDRPVGSVCYSSGGWFSGRDEFWLIAVSLKHCNIARESRNTKSSLIEPSSAGGDLSRMKMKALFGSDLGIERGDFFTHSTVGFI